MREGAFVIPLTVVITTTEDWDYGCASIICKENESKSLRFAISSHCCDALLPSTTGASYGPNA